MSENLVKPYELSLWKDKQYFLCASNTTPVVYVTIDDKDSIPSGYTIVNDFFAEVKLGTIGTEALNSPLDVYDIQLTRNLNGKNDLSFTINTHYWDNETNTIKDNPWKSLISNEQKLKLYYNDTWFDFIIKTTDESSDGKTIKYTCTDLFIEELSKNGYNIELNGDLMNNMGTINELTNVILDESEWNLASNSENIRQFTTETLFDYEVPTNSSITIKVLDNLDASEWGGQIYTKDQTFTITHSSQHNHIYLFQSSVDNKESHYQVLYAADGIYALDSKGIVLTAPNCIVTTDNFSVVDPIISNYRGKKLIESPKSKYIGVLGQTCTVYDHTVVVNNVSTTTQYYCQEEMEYASADTIKDLITNNMSFTTTDGWYTSNSSLINVDRRTISGTNTNVLQIRFGSGDVNNWIGNNGFYNLRSSLSTGLTVGDSYILLLKEANAAGSSTITEAKLFIKLKNTETPIVYTFNNATALGDYRCYTMNVGTSISYTDLLESEIDFKIYGSGTTYLSAAKMCIKKTYTDSTGATCVFIPDETNVEANVIKTTYKMFETSKVDTLTTAESLVYDYIFETIPVGTATDYWEQVKEANYAKVSSITAEKSNRFNLIQDLAEKFECWAKFDIVHNNNGTINYTYDATTDARYISGKTYFKSNNQTSTNFIDEQYRHCTENERNSFFTQLTSSSTFSTSAKYYYRETSSTSVPDYYYVSLTQDEFNTIIAAITTAKPSEYYVLNEASDSSWKTALYCKNYQKYVGFHEYIGQDNHIGFRYGINLKDIKRTLNSDAIVTKLIVGANSNEYADDGYGSCSIANSKYNNIKENFILNLDYYIKQGILDEDVIQRDLYDNSNTNGIGYLTKLSKLNKDNSSLILSQSNLSISQLLANASYTKYLEAANSAKTEMDNYENYLKSSGISKPSGSNYYSESGNEQIVSWAKKYNTNYNSYNEFSLLVADFADRVQDYTTELTKVTKNLERIVKAKEGLNQTFNSKYSRYLREGQWISEDYTSADKYYLDAKNVLYNSAYPQVSYTINVVDISELEGYNIYQFNLADETYIEDVEFFGKNKVTGQPIQEKVVVTQIVYNLNNPSNNTITIKNYDNRWDSLFQKITASTQSLQFHEGEYKRVADTVDETGTIKSEYLKSAFAENPILAEAISKEINEDGQGIEIISKADQSKVLRLGSSGIVLSGDGGDSWTTAISATGINANKINTGQLNTENIRIFAGTDASFVWDKNNLTAYGHDGGIVSDNKYVQFNQHGIYGYENSNTPNFKLGYDGFELNSLNSITYSQVTSFVANRHYFVKDGDAYEPLDFNTEQVANLYELAQTHTNIVISNYNTGNLVTESNSVTFNLTKSTNLPTAQSYKIEIKTQDNQALAEFTGTFIENQSNYTHTYTKTNFTDTESSVTLNVVITYNDSSTTLGTMNTTITLYSNIHPTYTAVTTFSTNINYYTKNDDDTYTAFDYLNYEPYGTYYYINDNNHSVAISTYMSPEISLIDLETPLRPIIKAKKDGDSTFIVYEDGSVYANNGKFRGHIVATSGEFSGELKAATGTFSGTLQSTAGYFGNVHISGSNVYIATEYTDPTTPSGNFLKLTSDGLILSNGTKKIQFSSSGLLIDDYATLSITDDLQRQISSIVVDTTRTYRQDDEPEHPMLGDLWYCTKTSDTTHYGKWFRYTLNTTTQLGEWLSCADPQVETNKSSITQTANSLDLEVQRATQVEGGISQDLSNLSITVGQIETKVQSVAKIYEQPSAPTSPMTGDIWHYTGTTTATYTNGRYYRYNGSSWILTEDSQIATNTSTITQQAGLIALKVDSNGVIGAINLSSEAATISASKINLEGVTTFVKPSDLTATGSTTIDGARIETGYISAARIKANTLTCDKLSVAGQDIGSSSNKLATLYATTTWITNMNSYGTISMRYDDGDENRYQTNITQAGVETVYNDSRTAYTSWSNILSGRIAKFG